jgi:hypothetical protein
MTLKTYIQRATAAALLSFIVVGINYGDCFRASSRNAVNLSIIGNTLFFVYAAVAFIIMRRLVNDAAVRSSRIIDDELGESDPIFARDHARMAEHNRELANLCMTVIIMLAAINQLVGVILAPRAIYDAPANGAAGGTSANASN